MNSRTDIAKQPIGKGILPVKTWNPRRGIGAGEFNYIDLSSIDQNLKSIATTTQVECNEAPSRARQIVHAGDVLISTVRPNLNAVAQVPIELHEATASTGFCVLRPDDESLDGRYLFHWVRSRSFIDEMVRLATGANYPAISDRIVKNSKIPAPRIGEQKRIAAILDKADAIRRKRQQAIQLADQFLRSVFLDLFGDPVTNPKGWDEVILSEVADIRSGVTKGKVIDVARSVRVPYMRVANVQDGYLDLTDVQDISVSPSDAERYQLDRGDILLTEGGDPDKLGRGYVWDEEIENCIHQNHIFAVRVHDQERINPLFMSTLIGSQRGKRYFLKVGKQTTGIATINKTVLSEFVALTPPVGLQEKYLKATGMVAALKEKFIASDMKLFESISQKAFLGKL